jgi:hypothetical protein
MNISLKLTTFVALTASVLGLRFPLPRIIDVSTWFTYNTSVKGVALFLTRSLSSCAKVVVYCHAIDA